MMIIGSEFYRLCAQHSINLKENLLRINIKYSFALAKMISNEYKFIINEISIFFLNYITIQG